MDRRSFIALAAVGTVSPPVACARPSTSTVQSQWQPDGGGALARLGVLTPDFDPVPESELCAMAPQGVSIHAARVPRKGVLAFSDPPNIDEAAEQLASLTPRAIVYAYTSSSYVLGAEADNDLRVRLEKRAQGIAVVLTCQAATEALHILGVQTVALVHPPWFTEELNTRGADYFRSRGFDVRACSRIAPLRPFAEVLPEEVFEWTRANTPRDAQAVFIGGNGLRAVGAIHALEKTLRRPVLTANQVAFCEALRQVGLSSKVTRYGRVFAASA